MEDEIILAGVVCVAYIELLVFLFWLVGEVLI